jgi:hypothetical protein
MGEIIFVSSFFKIFDQQRSTQGMRNKSICMTHINFKYLTTILLRAKSCLTIKIY